MNNSTTQILVIDPSLVTRSILHACLRREGLTVKSYADPVEALQLLHVLHTAQERLPALVFVAPRLPKIDGFRLIRDVKRLPPFQSMIFIALLDESDGMLGRLKARLAGARCYMCKPLTTRDVIALVYRYMWEESRQLIGVEGKK